MASPSTDLHFILVPLMAQGHMIPMIDIARLLAERGATVTIITTPVNANRYRSVIDRAIEANLKIQVLELQLELAKVGLPEGCECFDLLPSAALKHNLFEAIAMLEESAENVIRGLIPPANCIISDSGFPWTTDVATRLGIPRLVFYGPGCFAFLCIHMVANSDILDRVESDLDYFVLPGLPDRIEITRAQASGWGRGDEKSKERFERMEKAGKAAYGIVVNSFEELEDKYVEEFAKAKGKKVWCIGPVSLCNKSFLDIAERGEKGAINERDCLKWLDSRESGSVVYVCLGSLTHSSMEQSIEVAMGLELSNVPFIWFTRDKEGELEKWVSKEGYEERIKDRGLIVRGWAPQILILSHRAVGGFITHCGWNSTLEGISAGIPMVTWPHFAEQFLNERFIVDVLKIGVRIGTEVPVSFGVQEKNEVTVKMEDVKKAVEDLMNDKEESKERRRRAKKLGEMAKRAMENGGSSQLNMTLMIQDVIEKLANKTILVQEIV
ncbi:hypothetical protein OSB04_013952 [Centaurea solstitialis]|uniref:Glycosyltransferase n=1 Tax=Centaurea solstitialis TaxID=347529 RepID=A0AA38TLS1_9ASTR|nr:hypothetical protein OSB04_013952 [Centaurea solstitialis]